MIIAHHLIWTAYGWWLHAGHSPNSPYARRPQGEPFRR